MIKFTQLHVIECEEPTFWKIFFDPQYHEIFYLHELEFPEFRVTKHFEDEQQIQRSIVVRPKVPLPGPLIQLLGPRFRYVEESIFDKAARVWTWKTTPSVLGDRIRSEGSMRVEPLAPGRVQRVVEILVEAKAFGLGRLLESTAESQFRKAWADGARFTNRWISERCG